MKDAVQIRHKDGIIPPFSELRRDHEEAVLKILRKGREISRGPYTYNILRA
jgi:hypothetical protein